MSVILSLQNLRKSFSTATESLEVLKGIDLQLNQGEVVALIGRSGSGKTTLLQCAGLLANPSSGKVMLAGQDVSQADDEARTLSRRSHIGFVYQFHHLLPEFNAIENVAMPLWIAGAGRSEALDHARDLLARLGLSSRESHRPSQLSGGEQQRVSIARALANHPSLLLADEPTGNLDDASSLLVFELLMEVVAERKMAALIATHNLDLAAKVHRTVRLESGILKAV
jgi:lipoprotein-releasing system ATP-binding protein